MYVVGRVAAGFDNGVDGVWWSGPRRSDNFFRLAISNDRQGAQKVLKVCGWRFERRDVGDVTDGHGPAGAGIALDLPLDSDSLAAESGQPSVTGLIFEAEAE